MKGRSALLWAWIATNYACEAPERRLPVVTSDTLVLHTDWRFFREWSGVFMDETTGEEFIFSGDPNTSKNVRVFDPTGQPLHDIPLDNALDTLGAIDSFTFLAKDRLVVLQSHGESYAVLDLDGNVLQQRSLRAALCTGENDRYSLCADANGLGVFGDEILVGASWYGACDEPADAPFDAIAYYAVETRKCKLARLDPNATSGGLSFGACDMLPQFNNATYNTTGATGAVVIRGRIFVVSLYSPVILELDTGTFQVRKRIPIRYVNGAVGIIPPIANVEDEARHGDNLRIGTKAYVFTFSYDSPSQRYLAVVPHEVPEETLEKQPRGSRNWSLLVLDSSFAQVAEHVLAGTEYRGGSMLNLRSGTWVLRSEEGMKAVTEPKVFHRLRIL